MSIDVTITVAPEPTTPEGLLRQHLEGSYAALSVINSSPALDLQALRLAAHILNASNAYLLHILIDRAPDAAADAVAYLDDAYASDPGSAGMVEWVTEQLVSRGADLGELAARARAAVTLNAVADAAAVHAKSHTVTVNGRSDDLIEIGGDLAEEFNTLGDEYDLVAFPDGTVLRIVFDHDGVWRITPLYRGHGTLRVDQAAGDDARSDVATLAFDAPAVWALHGTSVATFRRPGRR